MDKNTTNHVAVDDGLLKMQEKIGNLGISTLKVTIKQAPDATNGHVAIAQTDLQMGNTHVSVPGVATPDTANSEAPHRLLSDSVYSSLDAAVACIRALSSGTRQASGGQSPPPPPTASNKKPVSDSQMSFINKLARGANSDTLARDLVGKPLVDCTCADADKIIKTLKANDQINGKVPW
nr:hypothetical protein [uncultured Desulfovibrio sp.]